MLLCCSPAGLRSVLLSIQTPCPFLIRNVITSSFLLSQHWLGGSFRAAATIAKSGIPHLPVGDRPAQPALAGRQLPGGSSRRQSYPAGGRSPHPPALQASHPGINASEEKGDAYEPVATQSWGVLQGCIGPWQASPARYWSEWSKLRATSKQRAWPAVQDKLTHGSCRSTTVPHTQTLKCGTVMLPVRIVEGPTVRPHSFCTSSRGTSLSTWVGKVCKAWQKSECNNKRCALQRSSVPHSLCTSSRGTLLSTCGGNV